MGLMMKRLLYILLLLLALTPSNAKAQFGGCLPAFCNAPVAQCTEASTFLARTSGLNALHTVAYSNQICGLVTDGIWLKFDLLYIYATQDSVTANLNLVSTSFNGTSVGPPTFTADRGFTGSPTAYITTGFNPTTATTPKFILNSAHISAWNLTNTAPGGTTDAILGGFNAGPTGPTAHTYISPLFTDGKTYFRVNTTTALPPDGSTLAGPTGHFIADRTSSTITQGYRNGVLLNGPNTSGSTLLNEPMIMIGANSAGTPGGATLQVAEASVGTQLSTLDATHFYNRLRTYMTAVGVP